MGRKSGEKARGSNFFKARKALKNKGFHQGVFQIAGTISSQGRYNHFDTTPRRSILYHSADQPFCQALRCGFTWLLCIRVKHRLHKGQRAQSRERWRFAEQIQPDLDCGKKAVQWEGAVRQVLPNGLGYFALRRACASGFYHITPAYFASTWLGDCMPRHVMMWSLDCRWYTASCFLPSSRLYIRMCR